MSKEGVQLAINRIANDLLALASAILEDDTISVNTKTGRNTLRNSALNGDLEAAIATANDGDPVITALFNHYVVFLEWTRPPKYKKKPPISVLKIGRRKTVYLPTRVLCTPYRMLSGGMGTKGVRYSPRWTEN